MKKLIITSAIFITLILISIFELVYTNKTCAIFLNNIKKIEYTLNSNDFQNAKKNLEILNLKYNQNQPILQLFLNRNNLDKIQKSINLLNLNINIKNKQCALINNLKIKTIVEKTLKNSHLQLYNIM